MRTKLFVTIVTAALTAALNAQVTGSGTAGQIPVWVGSGSTTAIGNSILFQSSSQVFPAPPTPGIGQPLKTPVPETRVGVGTQSPQTQLHVAGRIATGMNTGSAGAITLFPADGAAWFHIDNFSLGQPLGRLRISHGPNPGANEVVSIRQDGNVGIGNPDPRYKLEVAGDINITGGVYANGQALGLQGQAGDKGSKGDKGDQGLKGDPGIGGLKGDKGDKGDKGLKGDKGDAGAPSKSVAACFGGGAQVCSCPSGKLLISQAAPCTVTADTGTCGWPGTSAGRCCVCKP